MDSSIDGWDKNQTTPQSKMSSRVYHIGCVLQIRFITDKSFT